MRLGARAEDWRPSNPRIRPGAVIGLLAAAVLLYIGVAALIGTVLNGSGSPFLS
jgi:hypothetical protein